MTSPLINRIRHMRPCHDAVEWLGERDLATAWAACPRGAWLLWLAARAGVDRRVVVLAACDCAEPALRHIPAEEPRPAEALRIARAWARGEATPEEVQRAAYAAACYAASAAYTSAAAYAAASAAALAADAADSCATYAAYAANAAACDADAYASTASAAYAASVAFAARSADLVRARVTWEMVEAALAAQKEQR
jgi:hypothetical protein